MERQYENLIMHRGQLKGLLHKKEFSQIQQEIQDVKTVANAAPIDLKSEESQRTTATCRMLERKEETKIRARSWGVKPEKKERGGKWREEGGMVGGG